MSLNWMPGWERRSHLKKTSLKLSSSTEIATTQKSLWHQSFSFGLLLLCIIQNIMSRKVHVFIKGSKGLSVATLNNRWSYFEMVEPRSVKRYTKWCQWLQSNHYPNAVSPDAGAVKLPLVSFSLSLYVPIGLRHRHRSVHLDKKPMSKGLDIGLGVWCVVLPIISLHVVV